MTENKIKPTMEQTIYCLKAESERYPEVCEECQLYGEVGCDHCYDDTNDMAIKFLKELEQYRAIGTIEEFRALKEKSVAKKPEPIDYEKYIDVVENAKFLRGAYWCPNCKHTVRSGAYCDDCGQKLDWQ